MKMEPAAKRRRGANNKTKDGEISSFRFERLANVIPVERKKFVSSLRIAHQRRTQRRLNEDRFGSLCKNPVDWIRSQDEPFRADGAREMGFRTPVSHVSGEKTVELRLDKAFSKEAREAAKSRANIFEEIDKNEAGRLRYVSRAGTKLEEIIQKMKESDRFPNLKGNNDHLTYADLCGGPGGFVDCVSNCWGRKCKGFGITLTNKTVKGYFRENLPANFAVLEGGGGDITKRGNIDTFAGLIEKGTKGAGVDLVVADGALGVDSKPVDTLKIFLGEFLLAAKILKSGGAFVCKIFEAKRRDVIEILYLMFRAFKFFAIFKPLSSRPTNDERYLICSDFRNEQHVEPIKDMLSEKFSDPSHEMKSSLYLNDDHFWRYLLKSNDSLALKRNKAKVDLALELIEPRESDSLQESIRLWYEKNLAMTPSNAGTIVTPEVFDDIITVWTKTYFSAVKEDELQVPVNRSLSQRYIGLETSNGAFYRRNQDSAVFKLTDESWIRCDVFGNLFPEGTLIYAEEIYAEDKLTKVNIIETFFIEYENLTGKSFVQRRKECSALAKSLYSPDLRVKPSSWHFRLESLSTFKAYQVTIIEDAKTEEEKRKYMIQAFQRRKLVFRRN